MKKNVRKLMLSSNFCHSAQYWVPKMLSVNTYWFQVSLIQISKLNRVHHKVLQRWHINPISVMKSGSSFCSKDITYYKLFIPGPFFISTKRKTLNSSNREPFLTHQDNLLHYLVSISLSRLAYLTSQLKLCPELLFSGSVPK